jgi:hypothetical protein
VKFITWVKKVLRAINAAWEAAVKSYRSQQPEESAVREDAAAEKEDVEATADGSVPVPEVVENGVKYCHWFVAASKIAAYVADNAVVAAFLISAGGGLAPFCFKVGLIFGIGWLFRRYHVLEWLEDAFEDGKEAIGKAGELIDDKFVDGLLKAISSLFDLLFGAFAGATA